MRKTILLFSILLANVLFVNGQSASFVEIIPDARAASMGATGVASNNGAFSLYHNTAALALIENKAGAGYSYTPWMNSFRKGYALHTVAGYYQISPKIGAVTVGYRYFTLPKYERIGNNGESKGNYNPDEMSFDLGYAYAITAELGIAANVRYIRSAIEKDQTGTAFAGDLSLYYTKNSFAVGLSLMNLGQKISYYGEKYEMPTKVKLGGSYSYLLGEQHMLTGNAEVAYKFLPSDYSGVEGGIGAEYTYKNMLSARAGYHLGDEDKTSPNYATVGCGVKYWKLALDATYLIAKSDSPLKNCFWLTLGANF